MRTGAIICEYNPLHNGHVYHIRETRKAGITHLTAVLSGDFVQRGDAALLNKFDRARLALDAGADLVIELPVPFCCAPAEIYAFQAVHLLQRLHITEVLSFGISGGSPERLAQLADASAHTAEIHQEEIRALMREGCSYPAALFRMMELYYPELAGLLRDPNHLLAAEYLKAMKKLHAEFDFLAVPRNSITHDSTQTSAEFASAGYIRAHFREKDISGFIPVCTREMLSGAPTADFSRLEKIILYKIRTMSEEELFMLPDMTPSLAGRFRNARHAPGLPAFLEAVRTKSFTMARIRRILLYALMDIRKEDLHTDIPCARILAFNQRGRELLRLAKRHSEIPVSTSLAKLRASGNERFMHLQECASDIYGLALEQITSAEEDFRRKIIMQKGD